ncbi:polysaccharide deacetylase family protein [Micromonosporaceae bacterium Da 78-11]
MLKLSRRRIVLVAIVAALAVLPAAGWSVERSDVPAGIASSPSAVVPAPVLVDPLPPVPVSPAASPSSASPSSASLSSSGPSSSGPSPSMVAVGPDVEVTTAPRAGSTLTPVTALPPPVGWSLTDVPTFGPAPAPEPIVLPAGDEVPYLSRIPVTQPVAFLTIDDGYLKNPEAIKLFAAAGIPVTLFLTTSAIHDDVPFFDRLRAHGAVIEAHTLTHTELRGRPYEFQKREICGSADRLAQWYGRRPVLFRPPYGTKDHNTLRAAHDCGMKAAFMWKETVDKGKVRYQEEEHRVQPGDIILMHFRPAFVKDFLAALRAIKRAGLTPALLTDYVPTD